jgi:hypothetical protein
MTTEPQPPTNPGRRLLAMVSPPKPICDMTPEEIHVFAESLVGLVTARMKDDRIHQEDDDEPCR